MKIKSKKALHYHSFPDNPNIPSDGLFCISLILPEYRLDHKIEKTEKMWKNDISLIFQDWLKIYIPSERYTYFR